MKVDMGVDNFWQMTPIHCKVITSKVKVTVTGNDKTISG
jgi:hypothetical protein